MKYARLECGTLRVPQNYPCSIEVGGVKIYNPSEEQLATAGYKPLVEYTPEEMEGYDAVVSYREEEERIVQEWDYVKKEEGLGGVDEEGNTGAAKPFRGGKEAGDEG